MIHMGDGQRRKQQLRITFLLHDYTRAFNESTLIFYMDGVQGVGQVIETANTKKSSTSSFVH